MLVFEATSRERPCNYLVTTWSVVWSLHGYFLFPLLTILVQEDKIILEKYTHESFSNKSSVKYDQHDQQRDEDDFMKSEPDQELSDRTTSFFRGRGIKTKVESDRIILRKKKFR